MIIENMFQARTESVSDILNPDLWLTNALGGASTVSGERVDADKAMGLPAYWACIRSISEDVAKLPLITYRRLKPRGKERARGHRLYGLLHDSPNQQMTSMTFRETLMHWALGWGNGFAQILRDGTGAGIAALFPIHPSHVVIEVQPGGGVVYSVRAKDGPYIIHPEEMFHLHGLGDGYGGYSILANAAESIGAGLAVQRFGATFFGNAARPSGVLEHPGKLQDEALKHLRESWQAKYTGDNAHKPAILEEGMTWRTLSIPPEEAQFLETQQFRVEDIARWFRMPPHKIQHLLRATYTNIEMQSIEYVVDTLQPWLERFEQEAERKLFVGDDNHFCEHLVDGLLRGDQAARSTYYREQFNIGALSQNDIRELENRNPVDGGDTYYVPMNMVRSEDASAGAAQQEDNNNAPPAEGGSNGPSEPDYTDLTERVKEAQMRVFIDAAARVLRRETKAATKAAIKHEGAAAAFSKWAERFYGDQVEIFQTAFRAPVLALLDIFGGRPDATVSSLRAFAEKQATISRKFAEAAFAAGNVEYQLAEAIELRPEAMSRQLIAEICGD